ncbi:MAG: FUSC family protein [Methylocystis sp.]
MIGPIKDITRDGLLFSAKTFLAATIALWIALEFDLPRPYWALGTVYILAQPLAGAVSSKALYRFAGTIVGAAMAVLLVPNLVAAPELLCLGLAIWIGLCLFLSRLDRSPRSYGFMLAGYTAAIVGFPSVNAPEAIFDTAVSRVEEIVVGIICTAVVSRSLFPGHAGPLIAARIQNWLENAGALARHVLLEQPDVERMHEDQRRLAKDITDIAALTAQLPYDTSALKHASEEMRALQQRMTALLPILAGIGDRLHALHERGELREELRPLLAKIAAWIESGGEGSELDAEHLRGVCFTLGARAGNCALA